MASTATLKFSFTHGSPPKKYPRYPNRHTQSTPPETL